MFKKKILWNKKLKLRMNNQNKLKNKNKNKIKSNRNNSLIMKQKINKKQMNNQFLNKFKFKNYLNEVLLIS